MSNDYYTGGNGIQTYPITQPVNQCFSFTDKSQNGCERLLYSNYWQEQINLYGQNVLYFVNSFNLSSSDNLYGEEPTQKFQEPKFIKIAINLNENALMLSKYGLMSEDEVTAYVHISGYYSVFGYGAEPKSGDIFQLYDYGLDRPGGRNGRFYEITERLDQDIAQINPLAGHYVWLLKAKRFEYSFEPGLSGGTDTVNDQIFDDAKNPSVSGANKPYSYSADAQNIFDYSINNNDSVYGGY
jgi:hypothetical protein